jgi:cytochrome c oxidase cbb3-type subunit 3
MTAEPMAGHVYDGIRELDNRLPNWWLWTLYVACIFSVGYWFHHHTLGTGDLPIEAFRRDQREAAARLEAELARNPVSEESLQRLASESGVVAAGERIFQSTTPLSCAFCHKPDGSGQTGPNLTDDAWVYGGSAMDVYTTIMEGRPNGMPAWKANGSLFAQRATAYLMAKIKNTNRPGLPPQGKPEK